MMEAIIDTLVIVIAWAICEFRVVSVKWIAEVAVKDMANDDKVVTELVIDRMKQERISYRDMARVALLIHAAVFIIAKIVAIWHKA